MEGGSGWRERGCVEGGGGGEMGRGCVEGNRGCSYMDHVASHNKTMLKHNKASVHVTCSNTQVIQADCIGHNCIMLC